jgi:hypothetical protein
LLRGWLRRLRRGIDVRFGVQAENGRLAAGLAQRADEIVRLVVRVVQIDAGARGIVAEGNGT